MLDASIWTTRRGQRLKPVIYIAALLALVAAMPVAAETSDAQKAAMAFVSDDRFKPREVGAVVETLEAIWGADEGMVGKDADVSAVEKALLLLEAQEPPLARVRYMLRYSEMKPGGTVLSMIDLRRYNLGPTIREQTIQDYGAENTAGPEAFGVGPHVGWRVAFQADSEAAAMIVAAGRREIPDAEAAGDDCRARRCLDPDLLDDYANWMQLTEPIGKPAVAYPAFSPTAFGDEKIEDQTPAYVALQLAMAAGIASEDSDGSMLWNVEQRQGPATDEPLFVVIIDRNLGQEIMTDAALGIPKLGKEGEERWVRRFGDVSYQVYQSSNGPLRRRVE